MVTQQIFYISGKVQGVFFRAFCRQHAGKLGIKGYAKNLPDGRVKVVAQGDDLAVLADFAKMCRKGPLTAKVEGFEVVEGSIEEEFSFFDML